MKAKTIQIFKTKVFDKNLASTTRFTVNQGGSRSSKTYSLLQLFVAICLQHPNERLVLSIVRKTGTALRNSAYKDFIEILQNAGLYDDNNHNKATGTYTLFGNYVEFFGVDSAQKVRGRKRDYLYVNEANELDNEEFRQLILRTTKQVYLDYNPSDMSSFIYDLLENRADEVTMIKSTFMDNDFLEDEVKNEILALKDIDPEAWQVFGLGERADSQSQIYPRWQKYDETKETKLDDFCYGLDTGYTHPTALVKVGICEQNLYWEEKIYKTRLTITDLIDLMNSMGIEKNVTIWCDSADPKTIEELVRNGYSAKKSDKSVKAGIDCVKSHHLNVANGSLNIQKELRDYRYQKQNDQITEQPVKIWDDALDAARYGSYNMWLQRRGGNGKFFVSTISNW